MGAMFWGRLNRLGYAVVSLTYLVVVMFLVPIVFSALGPLTWIVNLALLVVVSGAIVRRLHDFGFSGNWVWLAWLPMLAGNLGLLGLAWMLVWAMKVAMIVLVFIPGRKGNNSYGAPNFRWSLRSAFFG